MPAISALMAAYNAESTVAEAIESVRNQSMSDWELLIMNDGSGDMTDRRIAEAVDGDRRIRVYNNKEPQGSGASRNFLARQAQAPVLTVCDADDISLPNRFRVASDLLRAHPGAQVASTQVAEFGDWGGPNISSWPSNAAAIESRVTADKMPIAHCAMSIRAEAFWKLGGYRPELLRAQDYGLLRQVKASQFVVDKHVHLLYRTTRPIPLRYVIMSGRYGRIARLDVAARSSARGSQLMPLADLRSIVTWLRRRKLERSAPL